MKIALLICIVGLLQTTSAVAQTIQRCEGAGQRTTYANAECPAGTRAVKALSPAPPPSAQGRAETKAQLQRDKDAVKTQQKPVVQDKAQRAPSSSDVQKAADCGYLQASLDSSRQLRNVLTTRPYYSTEDVEEADARINELAAEYRRVCG
ncbi:MAG: hypothetical protein M3P99_08355 [Pseudomonadota bacterium]|nr:hypothetical protein [Pseudomonadota bacterium]